MVSNRFALVAWLLFSVFSVPVASENRSQLTILSPDLPGSSEEGGIGRDAEMVSAALNACGYGVKFVVQPFGRHLWSYRYMENVDGVMTVPLSYELGGFSTAAYIWYQNGAFFNFTQSGPVGSVSDLYGRDVVTFQDGVRILGLESEEEKFASIYMSANQTLHSQLLMMGRVDAIFADGLIVAEINRRLREKPGSHSTLTYRNDDFRFAPIFNPTPYKMVFKNEIVAKRFDSCFDKLYRDGTITRINDSYMDRYRAVLHHRYLAQ